LPGLLVVVVLMLAGAASGQTDCRGKVGNYAYDLTPLAQKLGAVDLQTQDTTGRPRPRGVPRLWQPEDGSLPEAPERLRC